MKRTTYNLLKDSAREKIHCVFLDASFVYECGGDWRSIFKKAYNKSNGHKKKMFLVMAKSSDDQMERFCMDLVTNHKKIIYIEENPS